MVMRTILPERWDDVKKHRYKGYKRYKRYKRWKVSAQVRS